MNVRELFDKLASALERLRHIHVHCKSLHLPATEAQITGEETA
jgi:hypothetical protein